MTGNDLIAASLRRIGSLGQGEIPNGSESEDAQLVWNSMLDMWNTDRGNLYTTGKFTQNLTQAKQTYEMGTGAPDFNVARPVRIQAAAVTLNGTRWPLDLIGIDQYSAIVQQSAENTLPYQLFQQYGIGGSRLDGARWAALLSTSSLIAVPWQLYCDYQNPTANLSFWPVPGVANISLDIIFWSIIQQITDLTKDLTTDLFFPPGYVESMRLNLALKLCEEWGMQIPPGLPGEAEQALTAMRAINARNQQLVEGDETTGAIPKQALAPPQPQAPQPQQ